MNDFRVDCDSTAWHVFSMGRSHNVRRAKLLISNSLTNRGKDKTATICHIAISKCVTVWDMMRRIESRWAQKAFRNPDFALRHSAAESRGGIAPAFYVPRGEFCLSCCRDFTGKGHHLCLLPLYVAAGGRRRRRGNDFALSKVRETDSSSSRPGSWRGRGNVGRA